MNPQNRRVKKLQLPPSVVDEGTLFELGENEPLEDESQLPPLPPKREFQRSARPPSRVASIVRAVLGVALVISVSTSVAWAARKHVTSSSRFGVKDIDVNGTRHLTNDDVAREAGLALGANIFTVDLEAARQKLLADPWISDATLGRRLPGTILVQVTEREAGALVALGETYLASRTGEIFKTIDARDPVDLPIITGMKPDLVAEDREGAARTIRRAIDLANEYEHGPLGGKAELQEIHVVSGTSLTLIVGKSALALVLGEPPYRKKLEQATRVVAELEKRGAKAEAIMLDNEARPERVVVRMK